MGDSSAIAALRGDRLARAGVRCRRDRLGALPSGNDALREMIHEIKTPLNAIIGFAEIIDGQYFGPAHRRYRERAAEIVTNARSLLEAAEDLDFVAKLQTARTHTGGGTDFAGFLPTFTQALLSRAAALGIELDVDTSGGQGVCALEPELAERLLRRFTDAILAAAEPGERLAFTRAAARRPARRQLHPPQVDHSRGQG